MAYYRRQTLAADPTALTFDRATLALVGDASDLGLRPGHHPDRIAVTSPRTGRTAVYISGRVVSISDDRAAFHYRSQNRIAADATPGGLLIFND